MNNTITHSGIVERIDPDKVTVRIVQVSACASCKVAGQCHASERKEKMVEVFCANTSSYAVGQPVVITADIHVGHRAVVWGFVLPLAMMLAAMFLTRLLTGDDALAALCGLGSLVPCYGLLYLMRNRLRRQLSFEIADT